MKRYKRFLADVELESGDVITAHCANSGALAGVTGAGNRVWLSWHDDPKRTLAYSWELVEAGGTLIGVNTMHPNRLVAEALAQKKIPALAAYDTVRREVAYGRQSRIDFLLQQAGLPDCYLEVKNVHMSRIAGLAEFPDGVTARGTRHLEDMAAIVQDKKGKAVTLYVIQRADCDRFTIAADIDPGYATAYSKACAVGVDSLAYACTLSPRGIVLDHEIRIV